MQEEISDKAKALWDIVQSSRSKNRYWVRVLKIRDDAYPWSLHEPALMVRDGLRELGYTAYFTEERLDPNSGWPTPEEKAARGTERQIIIGANVGTPSALDSVPAESIVYNFEQAGSPQFHPGYVNLLHRCTAWEYHPANISYLKSLYNLNAVLVPFGYVPAFSPPPYDGALEYDVGFVGSISPQRRLILNELELLKLKVYASQSSFGTARDRKLQQCKVILNMHYYPKVKVMEVVRIGLACAMKKAVVSQLDPDTRVDPFYLPVMKTAPAKQLAKAVKDLVDDPDERERLEQAGYDLFTTRLASDSIRKALGNESQRTRALPQSYERTKDPGVTTYRRIPRIGPVR
jgi:hypothetical protein